jgi:ABC-2 type transport system permease protein
LTQIRIFFVGGLLSYRALFSWLSPWILIPTFCVGPLFQILLFAYIGRTTHLQSDEFYVVGNALQYSSLPCLFAMAQTVDGERFQHTLPVILATPAPRLPLFLGRSLPVIANGICVSVFAFAAGSALLHVHVPAAALASLALVIVVTAFSCTGLGLVNAAIGLRARDTAVSSNLFFGFLLVVCGVNVPLHDLPGWMSTMAQGVPLTHGIEAARKLANGASLSGGVWRLVAAEVLVGLLYAALGYSLIRLMEHVSRSRATLEVS